MLIKEKFQAYRIAMKKNSVVKYTGFESQLHLLHAGQVTYSSLILNLLFVKECD